MLAGNVFDWGAKEVASLMETSEFGFQEAMEKLQRKFNQTNTSASLASLYSIQ